MRKKKQPKLTYENTPRVYGPVGFCGFCFLPIEAKQPGGLEPRHIEIQTPICREAAQIPLEKRISTIFYREFMNHPDSVRDPGIALQYAQEAARNALPAGVHGTFDIERLTFTAAEEAE